MKKTLKIFFIFIFTLLVFSASKRVEANYIEKISMDIYIDNNGNTFKIFPDYIENCILGIKGVKSCAVGCIKDDKSINKIYSIIVKDETLSLDEIKSTIKTVLPEYNFPHIFKIVDEIPINAVGKTDYIKIEKEIKKKEI